MGVTTPHHPHPQEGKRAEEISGCIPVLSVFPARPHGVLQPVAHVTEVPCLTGMSLSPVSAASGHFLRAACGELGFWAQHLRPPLSPAHGGGREFDWHVSPAATPPEFASAF